MQAMRRARFAAATAALAASLCAHALDAVRLLIPAAPGAGADRTGHELGEAMLQSGMAKSIQYDNRPGASGAIALAQFVNAAKGDPNALLVGGLAMAVAVARNRSAVDLSQVTPVARVAMGHEVIVVAANGPATLKDLLDRLRVDPAAMQWGGVDASGTAFLLATLVAKAAGLDGARVRYVAFTGAPEIADGIAAGRVTAGIAAFSEAAPLIQSGKLRALAISSPRASHGIASLREQGVDVVLDDWRGIFAAPAITTARRDELVKAVEAATRDVRWQRSIDRGAWQDTWLAGDAFRAFIDSETKRVAASFATPPPGTR